ncbi:MAG: hypothetical protein WAO76_10125 [Georgfuchsia sp.]
MKTSNLSAHLSSALFSLALLALSLYMVGMSTGDWLVRYALVDSRASEFTGRICQSIAGCQSVSAQPLFNWHEGHRYVSYRITGTRIDSATATEVIKRMADESSGLLGFAVKTTFKVDVRNNPTRRGQ